MFNLVSQDIEEYSEEHTTPESDLLYRINRETHLQQLRPRMLSGQLQGAFLSLMSRLKQPKHILEIGTYTGYSALCLAEGLTADGTLETIEIDEELEEPILRNFSQSPFCNQLKLYIGDAVDIIPTLNTSWDMVFIDAEKKHYDTYYELILPKVAIGGLLLIDNVLWSGKVVGEVKDNDKDTHAIMAFNDRVQQDPRVRNLLLPFRDGILCIEKLQPCE